MSGAYRPSRSIKQAEELLQRRRGPRLGAVLQALGRQRPQQEGLGLVLAAAGVLVVQLSAGKQRRAK